MNYNNLNNNWRIAALIPVYNEEQTIQKIIDMAKENVTLVIVCDDGSTDATSQKIKEAGAILIRHAKNMGKGVALKTLFTAALKYNRNIAVTLDGDGQHDPSEIPKLIKPIIEKKADIVVGSRFLGQKNCHIAIPLYRKFGIFVLRLLFKILLGVNVTDPFSGFRAFSSKAMKELLAGNMQGYGCEQEQLILAVKKGLKISEVCVNIRYKDIKKRSKKNPLVQGFEILLSLWKLWVRHKVLKNL